MMTYLSKTQEYPQPVHWCAHQGPFWRPEEQIEPMLKTELDQGVMIVNKSETKLK